MQMSIPPLTTPDDWTEQIKMTKGMPVLNEFPEIKALGERRLQELCDDFRSTYVAKEFAIVKLFVQTIEGDLSLDFTCELTHEFKPGEEYYFPMDELLRFIADHGIDNETERESTKARIQSARQRGGPEVYRRFRLNPGPRLPLFLTCKNPDCQNVMQTQLRAYRCERVEMEYIEPITCPHCKQESQFTDKDLHFGLDERSDQ
jgi:hypothetical protein